MAVRLRSLFSSSTPSRLISFLPSSQKSQLSSLISPLPKPTTLPLPFYPRIEGSFLTHLFSTGSFGSIPAKTQTPSLGFPRSRLYHSDSIRQKPFLPDRQKNAKDHKRRLLAEKYELRRNLYKALCADPEIPVEMQDQFRYKLSKLPRNSSFVRVRNRCVFTARPRAVYQKFRMSRITFRELASNGQLNGVKKASW